MQPSAARGSGGSSPAPPQTLREARELGTRVLGASASGQGPRESTGLTIYCREPLESSIPTPSLAGQASGPPHAAEDMFTPQRSPRRGDLAAGHRPQLRRT